jgi:hypothetical protein
MIANLTHRANANNEFIDPTKRTLLRQIESTPGIRHRELLRTTKFSNGVMLIGRRITKVLDIIPSIFHKRKQKL